MPSGCPGVATHTSSAGSLSFFTPSRIAGQLLLVSPSSFPRSPNGSHFINPVLSTRLSQHAMFFQNTPSRFATLLYLGASLIWVSASPSLIPIRNLEVNVDLVIDGVGKSEHWFVDVGPTLFQAGTRDPSTMDKFKSKLTTSHYEWDKVQHQLSSSHKIKPLGKATFKDAADQKTAFTKVEAIRMKAAAAVKGGNCLDYITDVLELLKTEGHVTEEVVAAYKKEYDDNYTRVSKAVWGVDLQP
ncbi:hypothetical protein LENED_004820 [Lentinula edodes]|uniref:Uncharacterized protein n=1 Tax=Lentinula edodes TaxID=5353 RepID=A0A1Q3E7Q5_LENED|nr:hypothetical protein LENED_004820 [Lentinula edodes]